jgi:response regulator of citrate/malate metabolism
MKKEELVVLIVDDSPLIAERLTRILKGLKNVKQVLHAGSFTDAMNILSVLKPDLMLLDINLPDKSGIELLRTISINKWELMVIMFTNHSSDYYRDLCKSLGAYYFFDKTNEFEKIPDFIRHVQLD